MRRDVILGTAGHIDHGKTSLVKALTGVDCDRLPEEKLRGITIDIGFAALELDGYRIGIVDVPGHERFIKNMLAGATGIDLALLVVAADDSVMPQTREHLEILKLLGIQQGVVALSKADLVDETTRSVVELEIRQLLEGSFLEPAPIIPTSAAAGTGLGQLKEALLSAAQRVDASRGDTLFRLPIDRAFVVQGHGTVVTGSVVSGRLRVGDELDWHRGDGRTERVRVRSLNNHGRAVDEVRRGQRAGVNLAAVRHEDVRRGQELCAPGYLVPSQLITTRIKCVSANGQPLKHRLPVRVHVGTSEVMATLALLDRDSLATGQWGLAQLFLEEPVTAVWGQPLVLRDSSAEHTLGGGTVLQPVADKIRRKDLESQIRLEKLASSDLGDRSIAAAWFRGLGGIKPDELARDAGVPPTQAEEVLDRLGQEGQLLNLSVSASPNVRLNAERVTSLEGEILARLGTLHAENPLLTSLDRQKTLSALAYMGQEAVLQAVIDRLIKAKKVVGDARRISRADFRPKLSVNQQKLKDRIVHAHDEAGFQPPEPREFANQAGGNAASLKDIYEVAVAEGYLVKLSNDLFLSSSVETELQRRVRERLGNSTGATVAELRDLLSTTRKYAVPICEYLDRIGLTHREGDLRFLAEQSPVSQSSSGST